MDHTTKNSTASGVTGGALAAGILMLAGCSAGSSNHLGDFAAVSGGVVEADAGVLAIEHGNARQAVEFYSAGLARSPRDARQHTLLGYSYLMMSEEEAGAKQLARTGFASALRVDPISYWPAVLDGQLAFEQGEYDVAVDRFSAAVLARPGDVKGYLYLAGAAYMLGDASLAWAAASRADELATTDDDRSLAIRLSTLAAAALGERDQVDRHLLTLDRLEPEGAKGLAHRANFILAESGSLGFAETDLQDDADRARTTGDVPEELDQIAVDVTIVLAQNTQLDTVGLNLLDGLNAQFGRQVTRVSTRIDDGPDSTERSIIDTISLQSLNYNLNIFNRTGQYYQVVARPSLVATVGDTSEFFVGRNVKVALRGEDVAELEDIEIGVGLEVQPVVITERGARVRIAANRSFLTNATPGSFQEALSTFVQRVNATAQIRYGETLVLSGLSESVDDRTVSKTPGLGDLPVVSTAFKQKQRNSRRDAVIILITPSEPVRVGSAQWARPHTAQRLAALWNEVIDPSTNGADVAGRLERMQMFQSMRASDVPLAWPSRGEQTRDLLRDLAGL